MPRQAARLVLGRSAKVPPQTRLRTFSSTPKRREDDANRQPTLRERSAAAASAIGAMSRAPELSTSPQGSSFASNRPPSAARGPATVQPAVASLGTRLGANVISVRSLPKRDGGDSRPLIRRTSDDEGGSKGTGSSSAKPKFVSGQYKPQGDGPRFARPAGQQGGGSLSRLRAGSLGGQFKRNAPKRAGGAGGKAQKKGRSSEEKKKDEEAAANSGIESLGQEVMAHVRQQQVGGPARAYRPSVTLKSLVGWGPAVATNTTLGQAEMALRSIKVMGGGRGCSEEEQSFKIDDVKKWLAANKPIYFSNIEQKKAVMKTLAHGKLEREAEKHMDAIVKSIQERNGNNWGAFVQSLEAWADELAKTPRGRRVAESLPQNARPEDWLRAKAEAQANAELNGIAKIYKTQNTKTTREAVLKYVLKGEHPEVKYAEDVYGKLARYHAKGSTYTNADGAKFDEQVRKLVKVPMAGQVTPRAQAAA